MGPFCPGRSGANVSFRLAESAAKPWASWDGKGKLRNHRIQLMEHDTTMIQPVFLGVTKYDVKVHLYFVVFWHILEPFGDRARGKNLYETNRGEIVHLLTK